MERMVEHLRTVLEEMVEEPEQRMGELSLLSGEEREQVVDGVEPDGAGVSGEMRA